MPGIEKDEFTEIVDARIDRVDLVGGAANGHKFLIAKQAAGMIPADMVRDLIEKAGHAAATEGTAAVTDETVEKADLEVGDLIEAAPAGSTADSAPGSADWEAKDGDSAFNVINVLARVKEALDCLAGREALEDASGTDEDAYENVWDLQDACAAVDYAIDMIAPYAAGEKAESDMADEVAGITKTVSAIDLGSLGVVESATAIVKAGRVLSGQNESALRDAVESIQKVLASLPAAPDAPDEPVEKADGSIDVSGEPGALTVNGPINVVTKADAEPDASLVLVYDAKGNIIGAVDPGEITQFAATPAGAGSSDDKTDEPADDKTDDDTNNQDAEPVGSEPTSADLKPAPAADAGVGTENVPAPEPVEKGQPDTDLSVDELLKAAESDEDPRVRALVKAARDYQEQIEHLKSLPAMPKAVANGAPIPVLKGQVDQVAVDDTQVADLRKQAASMDVQKREAARTELDRLAAAQFAALRANPIGRGQ